MLLMSAAMALPGLRSEEISFRNDINGDNLWDFLEDIFYNYRIIVSAVIIFIGLFLCFLGKKSVKFNMFICGFIAGGIPTLVIATDLLKNMEAQSQAFWISIGVSCLMGIIVGVLLVCLYQIGNFVIGAALGVVIAVYTVVILDSIIHFHSDVVLYVSVCVCALEFGSFALVWDHVMVILGTSVIGSYMISFGVGQFIGEWFNPFSPQFSQKLQHPPYQWYVYLGLIAGFSILGIVVQAVTNKQMKRVKSGTAPLLPASEQRVELPSSKPQRSRTLRERNEA